MTALALGDLLHDLPLVGTCGRSHDHDWHDAKRALYDWEWLGFGPGADCSIHADGETYRCRDRSWIIIPPGVWHTCSGSVPASSWRCWVHFEWGAERGDRPRMVYAPARHQPALCGRAPAQFPAGLVHGSFGDAGQVAGIHARILHHFRLARHSHRLLASTALLELLAACCADDQPEAGDGVAVLERLRQALTELAAEPFRTAAPVRRVVAGCGQSYDHLARRFRTAYGLTPLQFVNAQRMSRAQRLLRESDLSVAAIASQLGFDDPAYFNRLYKQVTGITPGADR